MSHVSDIVLKAIAKRKSLIDEDTNALRLFDGVGDGAADLFLETFADRWVISNREGDLSPEWVDCMQQSGKSVYWKRLDQHQKDDPVHLTGDKQEEPFVAKESGMNYEISFSLTIAAALMSVIIVAALIGTFVPIILNKRGIDPAIATGPFITTSNDIFGIFLFFYIAKLILGF